MNKNCEKPLGLHLTLTAISHILNFFYCLYLFIRYGRPYNQEAEDSKLRENSVFERTGQLLCYDFVTLFYIFLLIFEIAWAIIGIDWISSNPSQCTSLPSATFALILLALLWIFLIFGLCIAFLAIVNIACEEGSCSVKYVLAGVIVCLTCGICQPKSIKKVKKFGKFFSKRNDQSDNSRRESNRHIRERDNTSMRNPYQFDNYYSPRGYGNRGYY